MSDAAKRKAKQKWAIEKPKLDNARQLRSQGDGVLKACVKQAVADS